jgi:hypothetical protein
MTFDEALQSLAEQTALALGAAGLAVVFWIRVDVDRGNVLAILHK